MTSNLFNDLTLNLPVELFTTLLEADNLRIEKIVSHGHACPESSSATNNPSANEVIQ